MLSMHNIQNARQAATYFSKDDYYLDKAQREPSAWWGRGAEHLGLSGEVDREVFFKLLSGELPDGTRLPTGRPVEGAQRAEGEGKSKSKDKDKDKEAPKLRRPGLDLTFSAPKSVSLLALIGEHLEVVAAHNKAVEVALRYLEDNAAQTRITENGTTRFARTDNFVVARFAHDTSRKQDPQLHTHCVVMNMTRRSDGVWRALSNEEIYRSKMAAGVIFRAELAKTLRQLGYEIRRTHADGRFEVAGFTDAQLEHFSQRRADIEAALAGSHVPDAKAAERVTLLTRQSKRDVHRATLGTSWRRRAQEAGIRFERPTPSAKSLDSSDAAAEALAYAVSHLSERTAGFTEQDLLKHALSHRLGVVTYADFAQRLRKDAALGRILEVLAGADARSPKYTTNEALAVEFNLLERMRSGRERGRAVMPAERYQARQSEVQLTEGQQAAARLILTTTEQIVGVQGYAGTGKSTLLLEVRLAAELEGYVVRGFAPSATAAEVLEKQSGIESKTLARHLLRPVPKKQGRRELWVVDEMSMVGNKDALRLLRLAQARDAQLVLLGDRKQLPSIEAGKVFGLLMAQGMKTAHMKQIVRQKDARLRQAVEKTVAQRPKASLALLRGDIQEIVDDGKRIAAVAGAWLELSPEERAQTVVVTPARADSRAITEQIRRGLQESGQLSKEQVMASILASADFTQAQIRESASYRTGDLVRFGKAYRRLDVEAGEYLRVVAVDVATNSITLAREGRENVAWQPHRADKVEVYRAEERALASGDVIRWTRNSRGQGWHNGDHATVLSLVAGMQRAMVDCKGTVREIDLGRYGHWDHGYVTTAHGAQGGTWRQAVLHLDTRRRLLMGHETWYVSISRAWKGVRIFTNSRTDLPQAITRSMEKESAFELVGARAPAGASAARETPGAEPRALRGRGR